MLYREIMAVCSQIHTKHINTLCGQNVELLNVKLAVHIVTTGLHRTTKLTFHNPLHRTGLIHSWCTPNVVQKAWTLPYSSTHQRCPILYPRYTPVSIAVYSVDCRVSEGTYEMYDADERRSLWRTQMAYTRFLNAQFTYPIYCSCKVNSIKDTLHFAKCRIR